MKSRFSSAVLVALLSLIVPSFAQKNHVDISLRGPWILYVDSSKSFANWPVLIAMAPGVDPKSSMWVHQPPIVSNGEAYQLSDLTQGYPPTDSQIYCLMFDGTCARKGASSLAPDDYPKPNLVTAHLPSGRKNWDWVTASRQYYAPTLILPVPNSYGADTAWPMRFGPKFNAQGKWYRYDDTYSTGVVLRYAKGPVWFDLKRCPNGKPTPNPTVANCVNPVSIHHTHLANNGTLHIEMKAPDTNWSCDPHVRRVYPEMLKLIGTSAGPKADWVVIDPAHDLDDNGNGVYDVYPSVYTSPNPVSKPIPSMYCLEHDNQGGYNDDRYRPSSQGKCEGAPANVDPWVGCVQLLVKSIPDDRKLDSLSENQRKALREIKTDGSDSALSFPRLAQMRRLDDNIAFLGQLKNELDAKRALAESLPPFLQTIFRLLTQLQETTDPYGKTHGDCGAPVINLTDK